jgi:hypothetical protein
LSGSKGEEDCDCGHKADKKKLAIIEKDGLRTVGVSLVRFMKASPPLQLGAEGFAAPYFLVFVWSHAL